MNRKIMTKIFIDIVMTVLYIILMFDFGTGAFFHEVAGIFIGLIFVVHVCLNFKTFIGMYKALKNHRLHINQTVLFILDLILPPAMLAVIITGFLISTEIFNFNLSSIWMTLFNIHNIMSYICLGILTLHMALHIKYLYNAIKKIILHRHDYEVKKSFAALITSFLTVCFLYVAIYIFRNSDITLQDYKVINSDISENGSFSNDESSDIPSSSETDSFITSDDDNKSSETQSSVVESSSQAENKPTLAEYLGALHCTGCGKHCLLTNPRCGKGEQQATQATAEYNSKYTVTE